MSFVRKRIIGSCPKQGMYFRKFFVLDIVRVLNTNILVKYIPLPPRDLKRIHIVGHNNVQRIAGFFRGYIFIILTTSIFRLRCSHYIPESFCADCSTHAQKRRFPPLACDKARSAVGEKAKNGINYSFC